MERRVGAEVLKSAKRILLRQLLWPTVRWPAVVFLLLVLIILVVSSAHEAAGQYTLPILPPDTTRATWTTNTADTTDTRATFLSEAAPFTPMNGATDKAYVAYPASSVQQRVGIIGWIESLPDSVIGTLEAATLTLYRLNSYDASGVNDSLEIAPVTVTWTEAQTSWINRRTGRPWTTPGGDVNAGYAVRVRAGDIPNLASGGAFAAVAFDITPLVEAWVAGTVAFNGVRLRWVTGSSPVVRFQDNAAGEPYRPAIAIQTYTVEEVFVPRLDPGWGAFMQSSGSAPRLGP